MGVVIHILDRRRVCLDVAGTSQEIGTLRHLSKVTELDDRRIAEIENAKLVPSPPAALVAQPVELPLASAPEDSVDAHPVIGWDEGRGSVSDSGWDYLPVLGYAVRDTERNVFVLHELRDGALHRIGPERAVELGLLTGAALLRRGQPVIAECRSVRHYIAEFAEADCILDDGRCERLLVRVAGDALPEPSWLAGRRPMDVESYMPGYDAGRTEAAG